ncbi:MAG TPA: hypothetical protein VFW85_07050 [Gaiellaceae bacterium]|nr:hypothetical protein [Gaiellaceae bacterium]
MKKLALVLVLAASVLLPGAARSAGCSPLDCAPTGSSLGHGLYAVRPNGVLGSVIVDDMGTGRTRYQLPEGILGGHLLVHQEQGGNGLTWFDTYTGRQIASASGAGFGELSLTGVSQDGRRAVLFNVRKTARFAIVAPHQRVNVVALPGQNWGFDALSGHNLYLLQYKRSGGYEVRRYDLTAHRLVTAPLKDPHESSLIWGTAWSRVTSPDGRYVFTLYLGPDGGAMVHELDVHHATARCVELPGSGNFNLGTTYTIQLSPNGKTLWAVNPGFGRVVGIDVASAKVRVAFRFAAARGIAEAPSSSVSDISSSGARLAVAVGGSLWVVDTRRHTVRRLNHHPATAVAFASDGARLWLANGTRLTALRL